MKKRHALFAYLALTAALIVSCGQSETSDAPQAERAISVKAELVRPHDVQVTRTFTGSLEGERQAVLYAKIAEAVQTVNVSQGRPVTANTVLVTLDKTGPSSNYLPSKSLYANAEKNYKKMEYLFNEGAVSESQYDAARTDYEVRKASFDAASQLVEIRTPISGLVTSVDVSEGDFVRVGQKLATVASTGRLRVKFGVNSADIAYFDVGADVTISSDVVAEPLSGRVVAIANSADPVTRAFEVEVLADNAAGLYKPGMFVRISIVLEDLIGAVAVPRKAVLTLDDKPTVFVASGGIAKKTTVTLGPEIDGRIVVTSGLSFGDSLVTLGQDYLDEGFEVTITTLSEGQ
ncbi:MAG: efflux RND transporter periplasmic adaptor subunit [Candidatus Zixiibacteriota bacterium]|nr:MAG: efflux RND transporter periplasmic adaptor subunit [candidate division Zixibacteria bacterium]